MIVYAKSKREQTYVLELADISHQHLLGDRSYVLQGYWLDSLPVQARCQYISRCPGILLQSLAQTLLG